MKYIKSFESINNDNECDTKISYDFAFDCLCGLKISLVQFKNNGDPELNVIIKDNIELQRRVDNIKYIANSTIGFTLADESTNQNIIVIYFDTRNKLMNSRSNFLSDKEFHDDYSYISKLFTTGQRLDFSTFKQVMRTDWDWEWKGEVRKFNKLKNFLGFK